MSNELDKKEKAIVKKDDRPLSVRFTEMVEYHLKLGKVKESEIEAMRDLFIRRNKMAEKLVVDFKKVINGGYLLEERMMILDFLLKTGHNQEYQNTEKNVNKLIYNYYHLPENHHISFISSLSDLYLYLELYFYRALFGKLNFDIYTKWREKERILIGKKRIIKVAAPMPKVNEFSNNIDDIFSLKNRNIKEGILQVDFPERKKPFIKFIGIGTCGKGWVVEFDYTFKQKGFEGSEWEEYIHQKPNEHIIDFFDRALEYLNSILISDESAGSEIKNKKGI